MPEYQSADGLSLHYTDEGDGLALICLPGLTRNSKDFGYITPHMQGCRLIKPDYRGRGRSQWADDWSTYSIPVESGDIVALMDHLELQDAAFLGTSRGGLIAMALAATFPDRVKAVALNDVGPVLEERAIQEILGYLGRRPIWKTHEEAAAGLPLVMQGFDNVPYSRWMEEARKHFIEVNDGLDLTYDLHLRDAAIAATAEETPDLWPMFDTLGDRPLCALRGANSTLLSQATFEEMQRRRPDMIAAEIPDRGHVPFLDEPASIAALRSWLEKIA